MNHVARTDNIQQILRIVGMRRVFHRIEVIQIAKEFVESVNAGQKLILVAQMVLAELTSGIAHGLEDRGDGDRFRWESRGGACLTNGGHAGADGKFAGDEVRTARRATRLGIIVGEQHAFLGKLVEVRRLARHQPAVVGADVPHADVVTHDDDDVGFAGI